MNNHILNAAIKANKLFNCRRFTFNRRFQSRNGRSTQTDRKPGYRRFNLKPEKTLILSDIKDVKVGDNLLKNEETMQQGEEVVTQIFWRVNFM